MSLSLMMPSLRSVMTQPRSAVSRPDRAD